jgi:hypothetical protein
MLGDRSVSTSAASVSKPPMSTTPARRPKSTSSLCAAAGAAARMSSREGNAMYRIDVTVVSWRCFRWLFKPVADADVPGVPGQSAAN